ncbi:MAG: hypothetical protein Q9221_002428 [Calogaya cf. arnoldii]
MQKMPLRSPWGGCALSLTFGSRRVAMSRTFIAVVLTFSYSASAIDNPPNPQLFQDDLHEDPPAFNLTAGGATCSRVKYGNNLQPVSCRNAWDKIERSSVRKRYGARSILERDSFDYLVPERYLSDDGLCAIDVSIPQNMIAQGRRWDVATGLQISDTARKILEQCVRYHEGGTVNRFSKLPDPNPENNLTCRKLIPGKLFHASDLMRYQQLKMRSQYISANMNRLLTATREPNKSPTIIPANWRCRRYLRVDTWEYLPTSTIRVLPPLAAVLQSFLKSMPTLAAGTPENVI